MVAVPAAGDPALSIAVWAPPQIGGSAAQLGINLVGMTLAGVATYFIASTSGVAFAGRS